MKERPILFSGPMVQAILDGAKTQTRRVVKPQPKIRERGDRHGAWYRVDSVGDLVDNSQPETGLLAYYGRCWDGIHRLASDIIACPYGQPGDRLWVRETWAHYQTVNHARRPDGRSFSEVSDGMAGYRADGHDTIEDFRNHVRMTSGCDLEAVEINADRWRPSIHMPRWASRILLEIADVRVQRLQDISEEDAKAEGCYAKTYRDGRGHEPASVDFRYLWESINGAGSWDANPWVWAISFRRVDA
jgi:hypothetical protein